MRRFKDIPNLRGLLCGILYNIPPSASPCEAESITESVEHIGHILLQCGHKVQFFPVHQGIKKIFARLVEHPVDVVVNLCEGYLDLSEGEFYIASVLELLEIPFTGASAYTLHLAQNKVLLKRIFAAKGILTPRFFVYPEKEEGEEFPFPWILKLSQEDGSLGLSSENVVYSREEFRERARALYEEFGRPILVEEYIHGREFQVGFWDEEVLPVEEIVFYIEPRVVCFQAKWVPGSPQDKGTVPVCPAEIPSGLAKRLIRIARNALRAVGYIPYVRVDIRMDRRGNLYVLEVNPNPDITHQAGFRYMLQQAGYEFENFLQWQVAAAYYRWPKFLH
ncbi:MAG: D-alanine--D-alanine ligase family protein [bacterium JZ-2024 1]